MNAEVWACVFRLFNDIVGICKTRSERLATVGSKLLEQGLPPQSYRRREFDLCRRWIAPAGLLLDIF